MFIVGDNINSLPIESPWADCTEVVHVMPGSSNHYLGFICIEQYTVPSGIVTDNVEGILEARLGVRLQVCVICTAFCTNSYWTNVEAKISLI